MRRPELVAASPSVRKPPPNWARRRPALASLAKVTREDFSGARSMSRSHAAFGSNREMSVGFCGSAT